MHISKTIDETIGGYSIHLLANGNKNDSQIGGDNSSLSDLFIPYGLYYQNDRAEFMFYKPQKAGTVDNALFDYLLDAVSKTSGNPTRKIEPTKTTNKNTRKKSF